MTLHSIVGFYKTRRPSRLGEREGQNQQWFSITFVMNNDDDPQTVRGSMLTVNDLERMIRLDLFHNMPDSYEEDVEDQLDAERWLKFVR